MHHRHTMCIIAKDMYYAKKTIHNTCTTAIIIEYCRSPVKHIQWPKERILLRRACIKSALLYKMIYGPMNVLSHRHRINPVGTTQCSRRNMTMELWSTIKHKWNHCCNKANMRRHCSWSSAHGGMSGLSCQIHNTCS